MKRFHLVLVVTAVLLVWNAWVPRAFAQTTDAAKPRLGVVMARFDDNFQTLLREAVSKEARKRGWKPVFGDGQSDQAHQNQLVASMIANDHVAALVVVPVTGAGTSEMTEKARVGGVPLVYLNRKPTTEAIDKGLGYVGSKDIVAGRLQGEYVTQQLGGKGNVAILIGRVATSAAVERTQGLKDVLSRQPGMHIVAEDVGDWSRARALDITKAWLAEGKTIDALVANNDEMAIGAIIALRKAGRNPASIFIMGVDATPDGLAQMDKGAMKATVYQDAAEQGQSAVDLAIRMKAGETLSDTIDVPFKLITPQNYKLLLAY
ncbi:substrate-binding domain-containing protein [Paraburkholderia fungorum]|uniref:substrate-binding domain-containing protein n=1 Tax=Paraburkholderia fungorum TaxID=134537 RepID=UPI0038BB5F6A